MSWIRVGYNGSLFRKTLVTIMEFGEEIQFMLLVAPAGPVFQVQE
jgi:hypothetical protein